MALRGPSEAFLAEPHLATLTTLRPDGTPHVVAVRFTWDGAAGPPPAPPDRVEIEITVDRVMGLNN
ncbi:pyridoxamine 5'-phosphate oxidase family protein [Sphaerisporangium fuscum]|uniref:pyridoxamine 5'-phosphate oxidase family protein n=1 Tax=Sphaerisporangium fuscum TaxID=2835868 RepID=UPI0027E37334|nr:pyridoxamine 5'-phosphate oxidase family protein [Sphaerisporangium fuscum]